MRIKILEPLLSDKFSSYWLLDKKLYKLKPCDQLDVWHILELTSKCRKPGDVAYIERKNKHIYIEWKSF